MTNDNGGKPKYNPQHYIPFGDQASYAAEQGWQPTMMDGGAVTYRNKYAPAFNNVILNNGKPEGTLQITGNQNGLFDVQIANKSGDIEKTILKQQPFSQVDNYFRNNKSIIQQRMDRTQADPNTPTYNGIAWNQ